MTDRGRGGPATARRSQELQLGRRLEAGRRVQRRPRALGVSGDEMVGGVRQEQVAIGLQRAPQGDEPLSFVHREVRGEPRVDRAGPARRRFERFEDGQAVARPPNRGIGV